MSDDVGAESEERRATTTSARRCSPTTDRASDDASERRCRSATSDTGPLPHWTEPPTGEMPRTLTAPTPTPIRPTTSTSGRRSPARRRCGATTIRRRSARRAPTTIDARSTPTSRPTRSTSRRRRPIGDDRRARCRARAGPHHRSAPTRPTTGSAGPMPQTAVAPTREPTPRAAAPGPHAARRAPRPRGPPAASAAATCRRPSPSASLHRRRRSSLAVMLEPAGWCSSSSSSVVGLAPSSSSTRSREKGYQPATLVGIVGCVAAPLAAYWPASAALPLVARASRSSPAAVTFIGAPSLDASPMPNMAITTLGVAWIGLARLVRGADPASRDGQPAESTAHRHRHAAARWPSASSPTTSARCSSGRAAGRTPLRAWISPNKTRRGPHRRRGGHASWRWSSSASPTRSTPGTAPAT